MLPGRNQKRGAPGLRRRLLLAWALALVLTGFLDFSPKFQHVGLSGIEKAQAAGRYSTLRLGRAPADLLRDGDPEPHLRAQDPTPQRPLPPRELRTRIDGNTTGQGEAAQSTPERSAQVRSARPAEQSQNAQAQPMQAQIAQSPADPQATAPPETAAAQTTPTAAIETNTAGALASPPVAAALAAAPANSGRMTGRGDGQIAPPAPATPPSDAAVAGSAVVAASDAAARSAILAPTPQPSGQTQGQALAQPPAVQAQTPQTAAQAPAPAAPQASAQGGGDVRLFGTVEFRSAMKDMPKWQQVIKAVSSPTPIDDAIAASGRKSMAEGWNTIKTKYGKNSGASTLEKLKAVNSFFNQMPYRTDMEVYGVVDYWATPTEFLKNSGDCEDYSITKLYALLQLGVPEDSMRLVVLKDTIRNLAHAVLAVYTDGDAYILDNLSNVVTSHSRLKNYAPQFSINFEYRWAHVKPKS